jgi:LPS sulfotransferase NodH
VSGQTYIVASTPRTGSSLLCEGLWQTGIAGRPGEVFAPDFRHLWYRRWCLNPHAGFDAYLRAAASNGTTPNGVFGFKIQWMHVPVLAREAGASPDTVLDVLFPGAVFVNTVRRDRRAQALSWYRAEVTGE